MNGLVVLVATWLIVGLTYIVAADVFGIADRRLRAMLAEDERQQERDGWRAMSTVKDDLLKAADYIEEHGWCQRDLRTRDGRVCLLGALDATVNSPYRLSAAMYAVWLSIGHPHPDDDYPRLGEWNDHPDRSKAEVVAALRTAAAEVSS